MDNDGKADSESKAVLLYACSRIKHTPLHWLCYWNDYDSVQYLLSLIDDKNEPLENINMLMADTFNKMSPLSMSGKHSSGESALLILEFFDKRFFYVEKAFGVKSQSLGEKETDGQIEQNDQKRKTWNIKYVKTNQLTPNQ